MERSSQSLDSRLFRKEIDMSSPIHTTIGYYKGCEFPEYYGQLVEFLHNQKADFKTWIRSVNSVDGWNGFVHLQDIVPIPSFTQAVANQVVHPECRAS
jgi:hypothetical protein